MEQALLLERQKSNIPQELEKNYIAKQWIEFIQKVKK
jgi:hypothetical protein